jgi:hypothetical protein
MPAFPVAHVGTCARHSYRHYAYIAFSSSRFDAHYGSTNRGGRIWPMNIAIKGKEENCSWSITSFESDRGAPRLRVSSRRLCRTCFRCA